MNELAKPQILTCAGCGKKEHFPSKSRSRKCGWIYGNTGRYCPACAVAEHAEMQKRATQRQKERDVKEYARWAKEVDEKENWPGNGRIARWIETRLAKAGIHFKRNDTLGGSIYFDFYDKNNDYCGTLRVADHHSPCGGGYNVEKQERSYGDADIDCNPHSSVDWKTAVTMAAKSVS